MALPMDLVATVATAAIMAMIDWISGDPNEDDDETSPFGFNEDTESEPDDEDDEDE